jgi:hypothetical protein
VNVAQLTFWFFSLALGLQRDLGFVFVQEWKNAGQTIISTTHIDGARLRQESVIGGRSDEVQIFDATEHILRTLDPLHKSYIEVAKESLYDALNAALKDMQNAKYSYRRTGVSQVGQWPCTIYEVFRPENSGASIKDSEICLADLSHFKITISDVSDSRELFEFGWRYSLLPSGVAIADPPKFPLTQTSGMSGVPVRRVWFTSDGSIVTTSELKEFRKEVISPSIFGVPPNFTQLSPVTPIDVPLLRD